MSRPTNPPTDDPATLRARLEKRYERPERPCTYDPADEEPEGDWIPPRPEPVEYDYRDGDVEDTGPAIGRPGLPYRVLHAELKSLRSYLRTLTNPDAPAEDVAAALDLLTDEDRELVAALTMPIPIGDTFVIAEADYRAATNPTPNED